jgi:hypothetical protein
LYKRVNLVGLSYAYDGYFRTQEVNNPVQDGSAIFANRFSVFIAPGQKGRPNETGREIHQPRTGGQSRRQIP